MSKPSLDLTKELTKLQTEATRAEQKLFSLNAEALVAQSNLDTIETEVARKTARLLAEQKTTLETEKEQYIGQINKQKATLVAVQRDVADAQQELSTVQSDVSLAKQEHQELLRSIEVEQDNLVATRMQQEEADKVFEQLGTDQIARELVMSGLQSEETCLSDSITSKKTALSALEQQETDVKATYEATVADREAQLRLLDAKLLAVTTEIEQKTEEEEITRRSLAEWQARLEAQDQNLRIREVNVAEGETKIVRNSTLLKL